MRIVIRLDAMRQRHALQYVAADQGDLKGMFVIVIERVAACERFDGRARQRAEPLGKVVMGGAEHAAKIPGQEVTKLLGCRCGDWFHATPPTPASILAVPPQTRSRKALRLMVSGEGISLLLRRAGAQRMLCTVKSIRRCNDQTSECAANRVLAGAGMSADRHVIKAGGIAATVKADGAELCSLKNADGLELLWQAGPEWPRHAPLLFPIVGQLKNDQLTHRGKTYEMIKHGVARDQRFEWAEQGAASCSLVLNDNAETRARYPFPFRLTVAYAIGERELEVSLDVTNTGSEMLPASIGGHPAFNWPLLPGLPKEAYSLTFSDEEPAPIRRITDGLMRAKPEPNPISGEDAKACGKSVR